MKIINPLYVFNIFENLFVSSYEISLLYELDYNIVFCTIINIVCLIIYILVSLIVILICVLSIVSIMLYGILKLIDDKITK